MPTNGKERKNWPGCGSDRRLTDLRDNFFRETGDFDRLKEMAVRTKRNSLQRRLNRSGRLVFSPLDTFSIFTSETFRTPRSMPL